MAASHVESLIELYEDDETAWLEAMARLAAQRRVDELDYSNLAVYLADMAQRDRREIESRLRVLIANLLKWIHQPKKRSRNSRESLEQQRQELRQLLERKSLHNHAESSLAAAYADGLALAVIETGLPEARFLPVCPYSLKQLESELILDEHR